MRCQIILIAGILGVASGLNVRKTTRCTNKMISNDWRQPEVPRVEFLQNMALAVAGTGTATFLPVTPAFARGRATLEAAYDRFTPRILAGGEFYKKDFRALIQSSNFSGIKAALAEPPKKTKEDRSKQDGGTAARAAQAGGFSDARVLVALDLYASAFSDNSISPKTKKMKAQVTVLRDIVEEMQLLAAQGLGEDTGGGLFGFGGKKLSKDEIAKKMRDLYVKGGSAWNNYIFAANEDLAVQFNKLPYL